MSRQRQPSQINDQEVAEQLLISYIKVLFLRNKLQALSQNSSSSQDSFYDDESDLDDFSNTNLTSVEPPQISRDQEILQIIQKYHGKVLSEHGKVEIEALRKQCLEQHETQVQRWITYVKQKTSALPTVVGERNETSQPQESMNPKCQRQESLYPQRKKTLKRGSLIN